LTVVPLIEKIIIERKAIKMHPAGADKVFWNSMVKMGGHTGSGGSTWFNGWINILYPFLSNGKKNEFCTAYSDK